MKKLLIAGILALSAAAQAPKLSYSGSFLEKTGFVASLGFSHASAKLHAKSKSYDDAETLSANLPNLSAGVKYGKFLATVTIENGKLKSKSGGWDTEYKSMGGLLNFDVLLGENDIFAILGAGISKNALQINSQEEIDGFSLALRAGGGFAKKITGDTYFFATGILRYSPKVLDKTFDDASFTLNKLLSFGANIGIAF